MTSYLRYSPRLEQVADDEAETIAKIAQAFTSEGDAVMKKEGSAKRTSHAKATGLLTGTLTVHDGLPAELAQGLCAQPGDYEALVRFAQGPGEDLPDAISTHRGMSIKLLGVAGERIAQSREAGTQDFVMETGPTFIHSTPETFLADFRMGLAKAPALPTAVKSTVSNVATVANAALNAAGLDSKLLGFFGHPSRHPLADAYFSQAPLRWGDYVAKLAVVPTTATIESVPMTKIDASDDDNAFRHAMQDHFAQASATFDLRVQLCTDMDAMPIEDAATDWSQEDSPYRTVATLTLPLQSAYSEERRRFFDEQLAFSPAHSVAAHRPLGGIMRARLAVYAQLQDHRQRANGVAPVEPRSLGEVPA